MMIKHAIDGIGNVIVVGDFVIEAGIPLSNRKGIPVYQISTVNKKKVTIDELIVHPDWQELSFKMSKDRKQFVRHSVDPKKLICVSYAFREYSLKSKNIDSAYEDPYKPE